MANFSESMVEWKKPPNRPASHLCSNLHSHSSIAERFRQIGLGGVKDIQSTSRNHKQPKDLLLCALLQKEKSELVWVWEARFLFLPYCAPFRILLYFWDMLLIYHGTLAVKVFVIIAAFRKCVLLTSVSLAPLSVSRFKICERCAPNILGRYALYRWAYFEKIKLLA